MVQPEEHGSKKGSETITQGKSGQGQTVLLRCQNERCRRPVVVRAGNFIRLLGVGVQIGSPVGKPLQVIGNCPSCNRLYREPLATFLPMRTEALVGVERL